MSKHGRQMKFAALLMSLGLSLTSTGCFNGYYTGEGGCGTCNSGCSSGGCSSGNCSNGNCSNGSCSNGSCSSGSCSTGACSSCGAGGNGPLGLGLSHSAGYQSPEPGAGNHYGQECPRELTPISMPPHRVAPPDILTINAIRLVPRPPYRLEPLETLLINVTDTLPNQPINGPFAISLEGSINLGYSYGSLAIGGMTPDQVQVAVRRHLANVLKNPQVNVTLPQFRGMEQVRGEHLVRPDGTIGLGSYGAVYVAGLDLGQAKCVVEKHLSQYFLSPQVSIDVFSYNSRSYYVIVDGAGYGQQVFKLPHTGNETVLDAISQVQGLAPMSSPKRITLSRPAPCNLGCNQILPIDWRAITEGGSTCTNYQVFPGDRIYVGPDPLIKTDNILAKVLAPMERILGFTLLGATTVQTVTGQNLQNNNNGIR
jgi:polysaccharide biosynthesis/export protein